MPNVPNNLLVTAGVRSGIDRNDGTNGYGTATNSTQLKVAAAGSVTSIANLRIEELEDSS